MECRVSKLGLNLIRAYSTLKADATLANIFLGKVRELHVVSDHEAHSLRGIGLKDVGDQYVTRPVIGICTTDFDIAGQKEDFVTDIDAVVGSASGLSCTEVIVLESFIKRDGTTSNGLDRPVLAVSVDDR